MSDQTYSFSVRYDRKIARRALNLFFRRRLSWTLVALPAVVLLFLGFYLFGSWTTFDQVMSLLLITTIGIIGYIYFIRHRMSDQFFRKTSDPTVAFELSMTGVKVSSEIGSSELKWKAFNEILKSADLWLLVYYGSGYLTLPIEQLSPACQAFIEERLRESKSA